VKRAPSSSCKRKLATYTPDAKAVATCGPQQAKVAAHFVYRFRTRRRDRDLRFGRMAMFGQDRVCASSSHLPDHDPSLRLACHPGSPIGVQYKVLTLMHDCLSVDYSSDAPG
jgi:hypothetical protein